MDADHNRIIAQAAKASLAPIGCRQRGRSRLWFDDQGWWVGLVEFQPSSWSKGSYLNVGAMWLWYAKEFWSFDDGNRVESFRKFNDENQFRADAAEFAQRAAAEVVALRQKFPSVRTAAHHLANREPKLIWDHYHAAISAALVGSSSYAQSQFEAVASTVAHASWVEELHAKAAAFAKLGSSLDAVRHAVREEVVNARALLKLPPLAADCELWG